MKEYQTNPDLKRVRRHRQRRTQRQRLSSKQIFIGTSSILAASITAMLIYFQLGQTDGIQAANPGDYRSVSSGNWQTPRTWETFDGSDWTIAKQVPSAGSNSIEIRPGHTVIVNTKISADQIVVDEGGKLVAGSGSLKIVNGSGIDLLVKGELEVQGKISIDKDAESSINNCVLQVDGQIDLQGKINITGKFVNEGGKMPVEGGHITLIENSTYEHAFDGGSLPIANWNKNSLCEITGVSSIVPENMDQSFGNFRWNCPAQNIPVDLISAINKIQNDINISSTGTRDIYFDKYGKQIVIQINGNLTIQGGSVCINPTSSSQVFVKGNINMNSGSIAFNTSNTSTNSTLTVAGEINLTGGSIDLNSSPIAKQGIINLNGNLSISSSALITETSGSTGGQINFTGKSNSQNIVVNNNIKNRIDINVMQGSTLRMDNYILTGNGNFTLNDGSTLMIGSPMGITKNELAGNIQTKGNRNYSQKATYIYNGGSAQKTGDGLPSVVYALTINNQENCTLVSSTSVSQKLNLELGKVITGKNTLTLGANAENTGVLQKTEGYVFGNFRRWVNTNTTGKIEFPVGNINSENKAVLLFTKSPSKNGTITCNLGIGNVNKMGLPLTDGNDVCLNAGYAYWNFVPDNGYEGGIFDLSLSSEGFPGVQNYEKLHISQREDLVSPWKNIGVHEKPNGTNESAMVNRKNVNQLGIFGITSSMANSLPTDLVYFNAQSKNQQVELNWEMACEINNDYFSIDRSENGRDYTSISTVKGAGNTSEVHNYQFTDNEPISGTSYYRLRQVSKDGKTTLSNIERVIYKTREAISSAVNLQKVGPNPFNSILTAEYYSESNGDVAVEILSTDGKTLYKTYQYALKGYNTFTYDQGNKLEPGQYMIRLSNSNGATRKFITKKN